MDSRESVRECPLYGLPPDDCCCAVSWGIRGASGPVKSSSMDSCVRKFVSGLSERIVRSALIPVLLVMMRIVSGDALLVGGWEWANLVLSCVKYSLNGALDTAVAGRNVIAPESSK